MKKRNYSAVTWDTFKVAAKKFWQHSYSDRAAALSYVTLLSIVPFISIVFYIISFLPYYNYLSSFTNAFIYNTFLPSSQETITKYLTLFLNQSLQLPMVSILFSVVTSVLLVKEIKDTLNNVFDASSRIGLVELAVCWLIFVFIPFFIGFSSFLNARIADYASAELHTFLFHFANFIILGFLFTTVYIIAINKTINWNLSLLGGYIVALLFELSRYVFNIYISYFTKYDVIYGALGVVPIFMLWVYWVWCIILFGALLICESQAKCHCT